jgi:hypothetical protein
LLATEEGDDEATVTQEDGETDEGITNAALDAILADVERDIRDKEEDGEEYLIGAEATLG